MGQTIPSGQTAGKAAKNGQIFIIQILVLMWKIKVLLAFTKQILIFLKFFESFSII